MITKVLLFSAAAMINYECFAYDWDGEAYAKLEYAESLTHNVPPSKKNNSKYIDSIYERLCKTESEFASYIATRFMIDHESEYLIKYRNKIRTRTKEGNQTADRILETVVTFKLDPISAKEHILDHCYAGETNEAAKLKARNAPPTAQQLKNIKIATEQREAEIARVLAEQEKAAKEK